MRLAITLLAIILGLLVAVAMFQVARPPEQPPAPEPTAPAVDEPDETAPPPVMEPELGPDPEELEVQPIPGLRLDPPEAPSPASLGEADPDGPYRMRVDLTGWGAAVRRVELAGYRGRVDEPDRYVVLETYTPPIPGGGPDDTYTIHPYTARRITVNDQTFDLATAAWHLAHTEQAGTHDTATYTLRLVDGEGEPVLELRRRYVLYHERYGFDIEQSAINLSDQPLVIRWEQLAQGDLPLDPAAYLGDRRMYLTGYFHPRYDPQRLRIRLDDGIRRRDHLVRGDGIWPHPSPPADAELAWLASENRYFLIATHPRVTPEMQATPQVPALEASFPDVGTWILPDPVQFPNDDARRALIFTLGTDELALPPGQAVDLDMGVYAGPRQREQFRDHPYNVLHLDQTVRYELGCAMCTFQWLARLLLAFLKLIHAVLMDWGMAIIVLVVFVRLLLHPITKRAQTNMMKMGKQMQAIQPEMEKLRKKYKDDPQQLNKEMMSLYREKGINPANMLGCLPLLLQAPIWIALYAMLYFAVELRHQEAFYGIFQGIGNLFGFHWRFLADLSSPDHFIYFGETGVAIPLPFIQWSLTGLNVLPILMGVVFYFNMKLTAPPAPQGPLSDQQEMMQKQQKMMRTIFPFLFPVLLYPAPAGLTLYICASTFAGIVDSWIVRRHVAQMEEEGRLFEKKPRKPGGFMDRMAKAIEAKQKQVEAMQQQAPKQKGGGKGKPKGKGKGKGR